MHGCKVAIDDTPPPAEHLQLAVADFLGRPSIAVDGPVIICARLQRQPENPNEPQVFAIDQAT